MNNNVGKGQNVKTGLTKLTRIWPCSDSCEGVRQSVPQINQGTCQPGMPMGQGEQVFWPPCGNVGFGQPTWFYSKQHTRNIFIWQMIGGHGGTRQKGPQIMVSTVVSICTITLRGLFFIAGRCDPGKGCTLDEQVRCIVSAPGVE
jgi:hypothetical protein